MTTLMEEAAILISKVAMSWFSKKSDSSSLQDELYTWSKGEWLLNGTKLCKSRSGGLFCKTYHGKWVAILHSGVSEYRTWFWI